jgi:DNA-binding response OmpR family regulator
MWAVVPLPMVRQRTGHLGATSLFMGTESMEFVPMDKKMTVALLLEDEPLIAIDIENELAEAGLSVFTVLSCADAEQWLKTTKPDLVIVDIVLRDGPSTNIVASLRRANIPFIVHSGDNPSNYQDTDFATGQWVNKPAAQRELLSAVQLLFPSLGAANFGVTGSGTYPCL